MLFRSEEDVHSWCKETGREVGDILPLPQIWKLCRNWYPGQMEPTYRGFTPEDLQSIFERSDLRDDFWRPAGLDD